MEESPRVITPYHELVFINQVRKFQNTLDELRLRTLASMRKKLNSEQMDSADKITERIIQKVAELPITQIRSTGEVRNTERLVKSLNELFNMEIVNNVKP